ncbi:MAG TPA: NAD(P)-binding domain-containing protein [Candidatus Limnocylindrales bacterium]
MRIAILGAGNVGGGLGNAFAAAGHEVVFGVRDPDSDKTRAALANAQGASATSPADAVANADVVCFALRWDAVPETVAALPPLDGRVVIDAMNRFGGDPARSTTQDLADLLPGARLAKAFNTIGYENFTTARDRTTRVAMFVAGDDPEAKRVAMELAAEIGFQPEDAGGLANARSLEEMVRVWLALTAAHGRTVGFALSEG